jgi:hypothetical protein
MRRQAVSGTLRAMLFLASTLLGTPFSAGSTSSPPDVHPTKTPSVVIPSVAGDGHVRMNRYFQTCKNKATEIEGLLGTLHRESVAATSVDKAAVQKRFLAKLQDRYPGATFDGAVGTVPFKENFTARFNATLKVESIKQSGKINLEYLVNQGRILVTGENNSVTVLLDQNDPARSTYIDVRIPAIKKEAERILLDPDRKRIAADTPEAAIMNDAYQLLSLTTNQRMDVFAANIIQDPLSQQELLKIASDGYRQRHQQEYLAPDPNVKKIKKVDAKPNKPADKRFYEGFMKTSAYSGVRLPVSAG